MSIFPKEVAQYDWAEISLVRYLEEYEGDESWEIRSKIRADTLERVRQGLPSKKVVLMRRPKEFELTIRQVNDMLASINAMRPYSLTSYKVLYTIETFTDSFSSGDIALAAFGPSDKPYEKGRHEQNVKRMIFAMRRENLLLLYRRRFNKLPVWQYFWTEVSKIYESGKFIERKDILR